MVVDVMPISCQSQHPLSDLTIGRQHRATPELAAVGVARPNARDGATALGGDWLTGLGYLPHREDPEGANRDGSRALCPA